MYDAAFAVHVSCPVTMAQSVRCKTACKSLFCTIAAKPRCCDMLLAKQECPGFKYDQFLPCKAYNLITAALVALSKHVVSLVHVTGC